MPNVVVIAVPTGPGKSLRSGKRTSSASIKSKNAPATNSFRPYPNPFSKSSKLVRASESGLDHLRRYADPLGHYVESNHEEVDVDFADSIDVDLLQILLEHMKQVRKTSS